MQINQTKALSWVNQALYLSFFIALIGTLRAISSISIGLILLVGIISNRARLKALFLSRPKNIFLIGSVLFYLLHIIALVYTLNRQEGWNDLRIKTGLLITPLAVTCSGYLNDTTRRKLFFQYCLLLAAASAYCLVKAFLHYSQTGDISVFFYHALVSPLNQHAIYYSILVFIALVFLLESVRKNDTSIGKRLYISLLLFLSIFLFLLSSKLVLLFYLLYLLYYFMSFIKNRSASRAMGIAILVLFAGLGSLALIVRNPVSKRFNEIINGGIQIIGQEKFDPGDYFNGLQFRLLQWKFVKEILDKNDSWLLGVSPGDAQFYLDQEYISKNMYLGDPQKEDRGYLAYNTHNQFLETILQTGITGLVFLLLLCICFVQIAWQKKSLATSFVILLLLAWLLIESVFETQYGLIIFTFFPFFMGPDGVPGNSIQRET